ncbi:MAG: lipopolysaccharide biosynthesis protein, partial [Stellaceae bacterium]
FGIVAMAMVAMGLIRVFSTSGQDLAVIRHPNPTAEHFDTAWTMSVCAGCLVALVLVAIAPLAGWYYHDPRVVPVIRFLALAPLLDGLTNIGAVAGFRRSLMFRKEFGFVVVSKLSAVIVAVPLAFALQNYWALAIAAVCGRVVTVIASYRMHPFRPHLRLTKLREIWSYSAWIQFSAIGGFFGEQADQIIVGGVAGAAPMGVYNVAADFATAPTEEIVVPASRATFPVYASLLHDPAGLAHSYLSVLSITALIALSTGFGVALVADDLVAVVFGPKWSTAALLIPWLAISGGLLGVARSVNAVLSVTGHARLNAMRIWAFAALLVPAAIAGGLGWGAEGVAAARMFVTILFIPLMFHSLMRIIPVHSAELFACMWRPALAALAMSAAISFAGNAISLVPLRLFCNVGMGAVVFAASVLALWFLAGRPAGAERILVAEAKGAMRALRTRTIEARARPSTKRQADV